MSKWKITLAAGVLLAALASGGTALASDSWELPLIGTMKLPKHVTFEEGAQAALPFMSSGKGVESYFSRKGMREGHYYTMTYANPPHYTYGWAMSQEMGIPFLLDAGLIKYKNGSTEEQMDAIAGYINSQLKQQRASYTGSDPLVQVKDKKGHHWEGSFVITTTERPITYREAYQMVLLPGSASVLMGVIDSDADQEEVTNSLKKMLKDRKPIKEKHMIDKYLNRSSEKD
jgi:hypothetical protein